MRNAEWTAHPTRTADPSKTARAPDNAPLRDQGFGVAQGLLSDDGLSEASTFSYRPM